ncbi:MAG TPA: serine/threonine-protein kinase [Trebonia sp.]|nr:serine/threonine-protein kinase [Trebonia sp.]
MTPERLGSRYLLEERIGEGGLGVVWRGRDVSDGTTYAIKLLRPEHADDPGILTRFVRERTAMLRFRHPNVVTLHDMIVERDRLALVMDFVAGGDLASYRQRRGGALPPAEAADLTAQICSALAAAHAAGIVHRDLKPANVLLDCTGAPGRRAEVRLTDFGIARISGEPTVTTKGYFVGTLSYLAPEVIQGGEPTPACDIYAAGVTLYELLAGRPPFTGQAAAIMYEHLQGEPTRTDSIPGAAWQLITACMAKDPARRPSAAELESALRGAPQPATSTSGWHAVQLPPAGDPTEIRSAVPSGTTWGMAAAPSGYAAATGAAAFAQPASPAAGAGGTAGGQVAESWSAAWSEPTGLPAPAVPDSSGQPRRPGRAAGRHRVAWAGGVLAVLIVAGVTIAVTRSPTATAGGTHIVAASLSASPAGKSAAGTAPSGTNAAASSSTSAPGSPTPGAATSTVASTAAPPPHASASSAAPSSAPRSSAAASSTVPANTAWQCGPAAAATLYTTGEDTGQTLQACIRVDDGKLELRGTLSPTVASWNEQIILVLKDANEQDHGRYESAACSAADCTYSVTITPPSRGKWTVLPEWERYLGGDNFQSTGHQPGLVSF